MSGSKRFPSECGKTGKILKTLASMFATCEKGENFDYTHVFSEKIKIPCQPAKKNLYLYQR